MNKVFKVIWNEARSAYVVVSEIAKNHGSKSCSTKKLLAMLIATGVMTCASMAPVMAAPTVADDATVTVGKKAEVNVGENAKVDVDKKIAIGINASAKGAEGVAIGKNSEAGENGWATAIGANAKATGNKSVVVGNSSKASGVASVTVGYNSVSSGDNAISIGLEAEAAGKNSFAFGYKANASGESSVAFGNDSKATDLIAIAIGSGAEATGEKTIAIGGSVKATGLYSVAIGNNIDKTGEKAVAIGQQTKADGMHATAVGVESQAQYKGATAIGTFAKAIKEGSIALGYNSYADREAGVQGYDPLTGKESTSTSSLAWKSGKGALSIGSAGGTRQIINVAAGSADTDAVNVAQLKKVGELAEKGWQLSANGGKATKVEPGAKVDFSGDDENITVSKEGTSIKVKLNRNLHVDNVNAGDYFFSAEHGIGFGGKAYITQSGLNANNNVISNVAAGEADIDAVNVGQLKDYVAANDTHIKSGDYAVGEVTDSTGNKSQGVSMDIVNKEGKVTGTVTITDVAKASDVGDVNKFKDTDLKNKDGSHTTVVDAVNNLNNKVGDLQYSKVEKGDIADGDSTTTAIGKLDQKLTDVAATAAKHTTVTAGDNMVVTETTNKDGGKEYNVALNKDISLDSVTTGKTVMNSDGLKVGKDVSVTATAVTAGKTSISDEGVKVGDKTYISADGLNANNQKVTNVADADISETSKDAVNGSQLYKTNQEVANNATNISSLSHSISNLDNRVNKVGAGAAALAALHPLDFDPDAKWDFAAGYGNYRGANAAAVGAYYRPNEDTMFSVGGTFGNGENMVNAGVSFKLGSGSSHVSTSRVAMAKEIKELRGELEAMKSAMLDANAGKKIDTSKLQLFPDVPQNHWAYEYVAQLAGNGMIEGYSDGNFAGDRPMTRYEFAAILYRAMTKGAVLSDKILSEFSHELEYFTVDTVAKDKAGNPTIQRVRTVKENKNK